MHNCKSSLKLFLKRTKRERENKHEKKGEGKEWEKDSVVKGEAADEENDINDGDEGNGDSQVVKE